MLCPRSRNAVVSLIRILSTRGDGALVNQAMNRTSFIEQNVIFLTVDAR